MSEININSGGGNVNIVGSNLGGERNIVNFSSSGDIVKELRRLIAELEKVADIPSKEIEKAKSDAEAAIEAAKESDKDQLVKRLDNIQKIFSSLKESTASALSLGKLIGEILLAVQKFNF